MNPSNSTHPSRFARSAIRLTVAAAIVASTVVGTPRPTEAAVIRPFATRFTANTTGAIVMTGNTSLTCPSSASGCLAARNASVTAGSSANNNSYSMTFVDIDQIASTFNSSRNTLTIPATADVAWAGLYWGADTSAGTGGAVAPSGADRGQIRLETPASGGYVAVAATQIDTSPVTGGVRYQAFADVTTLVAAGRSGEYTAANLQAGRGQDRYGGWALVVAYRDPTEPLRNLTIFDGYAIVQQTPASDQNVAVPVSGFLTPPSGPVRSRLGVVAYEGDVGLLGDSLRLNETPMSNALNPATNFFNSSIGALGSSITTGDPYQSNLLGIDIDTVDASGVLANGATSATINLRTNNDTYFPGVVSFSTELFAPQVVLSKSAVDTNGGTLDTGDEVLYTIVAENRGQDAATGFVLTDEIPDATSFVPGSLTIDGVAVTDAAGDDRGEFAGSPDRIVARTGSGSGATNGGTLAIGATSVVSFRVVVGEVPTGDAVTNVARAAFTAATSGLPIDAISNGATLAPRPRSDLSVLKFGPAAPVTLPGIVDYRIVVSNRGPAGEPAAVVTDTLPAGFALTSALATQGSCTGTTIVTCDIGALDVGATATVAITGTIATDSGVVTNTVQVGGSNLDRFPNNDTARAVTELNNPPVAVDQVAATPSGTPVTIAALAGASDPDGDPVTVIAAGPTPDGAVVVNADGTVTFVPAPGFVGTASISFTVADGRGGTSTAVMSITVSNAPPTAVDDAVATLPATPVTIDVLANDTDANGDAVTVVSVTQPPASEGAVMIDAAGTVTFTPTASFSGTSTFTYTISDGVDTATATVTVQVPNSGPVAVDDAATTPSATPVVIDVIANDLDDNGDDLTVTTVGQPVGGATIGVATIEPDGTVRFEPASGFKGIAAFDYTITDGGETASATVTVDVLNAPPVAVDDATTTASGTPVSIDVLGDDSDPNADLLVVVAVTPAANGSVVLAGDGTLVYTPVPGFRGDDVFTYTVGDGTDTATATVIVTVLNAPPVAAQDRRTTASGQAVDIDVLANDLDINGDALTVSSVISGGPSNGTAVTNADGTITYTPTPGFAGLDTFTYTVSDGTDSATALVTVTVLNAPPVALDDDVSTPAGVAIDVEVLVNDRDPNGDTLSVVPVIPAGPSHGTAVVDTAGTVTYTPDAGFVGTDEFTYVITDGVETSTAIVTVTVTAPSSGAGGGSTTVPTTVPTSAPGTVPSSGGGTTPTVPTATVPTASVPTASVPTASVPTATVPTATVPIITPTATVTTLQPFSGRLPSTGGSPLTGLALGASAIVAGSLLVHLARRRSPAPLDAAGR